jgi:hypothetical protein
MLERYIYLVQKEKSYVGGDGVIEDSLWSAIKKAKKQLTTAKIPFPEYESVECDLDDWV